MFHDQNKETDGSKEILLLFRNHLIPGSPKTMLILLKHIQTLEEARNHEGTRSLGEVMAGFHPLTYTQ